MNDELPSKTQPQSLPVGYKLEENDGHCFRYIRPEGIPSEVYGRKDICINDAVDEYRRSERKRLQSLGGWREVQP